MQRFDWVIINPIIWHHIKFPGVNIMSDDSSPSDFNSSDVQVFNINTLKDFNQDKRVRKKLFKTEQLWSEIVCYEPGQATAMHKHPLEEEMFFVIEGKVNMNIGGIEGRFSAGEVVRIPANVMHDARNLENQRLVIMFTKSPRKIQRKVS